MMNVIPCKARASRAMRRWAHEPTSYRPDGLVPSTMRKALTTPSLPFRPRTTHTSPEVRFSALPWWLRGGSLKW